MGRESTTLGVNRVQCGTIKAMTNDGVETCFVLRAEGQPSDTAVQLAVQPSNLPEFVKAIVESARNEFPEAMRQVPPL